MTTRAVRGVERIIRTAWRPALRDAAIAHALGNRERWTMLEDAMGNALARSSDAGRNLFLPTGYVEDLSAFFDASRRRRAIVQERIEKDVRQVSAIHGDEMTAILYLLFFDVDDGSFRRVSRGVPAAVARRGHGAGIPSERVREAHVIASSDPSIRVALTNYPRRTLLAVEDAAMRAFNLGIAQSAIADSRGLLAEDAAAPKRERTQFPLWSIAEIMDARTRGNPTGIYRHDGFHWQVNGYTNTMDEIVRQDCVPPCGHNCRASLVPLRWSQAESLGLVNADGTVDYGAVRAYNGDRQSYIDRGLYPDPEYR